MIRLYVIGPIQEETSNIYAGRWLQITHQHILLQVSYKSYPIVWLGTYHAYYQR